MEDRPWKGSEPSWLNPINDRKAPYSDAELDRLTDDQIAMLADTPAWWTLAASASSRQAREIVILRVPVATLARAVIRNPSQKRT